MFPEAGWSIPAIVLMVVVFPEPFDPTIVTISFGEMARDASHNT
jgi:hypothetical protein